MPIISVMMPVYNGAKYIGESIDSVLAQTCQDWELLIIDDGSTDNTMDVIEQYKDSRIRVIQQNHAGEGAARNRAVQEAQGQYITFLDSDDWFLPNALQAYVEFLNNHSEYDVVYSDGYKCNENGIPIARFSDSKPGFHQGNVLEMMIIHPLYGVPCAASFRRKIALEHRLQFNEALTLGTDWDFFIQLAEVALFGYINTLTCKYRLHSNSISAVLSEKRREFHVQIQSRVLKQLYFSQLSVHARSRFFYQLLIEHLKDKPEGQQEVFESPQFRNLTPQIQASLLRLVAEEYILSQTQLDFVKLWLRQAIELDPGGFKQRGMWGLFQINAWMAGLALKTWRGINGIHTKLQYN